MPRSTSFCGLRRARRKKLPAHRSRSRRRQARRPRAASLITTGATRGRPPSSWISACFAGPWKKFAPRARPARSRATRPRRPARAEPHAPAGVGGGWAREESKAVDHRGLRSVGARATTTTGYNTTRYSRYSAQLGKVFRNSGVLAADKYLRCFIVGNTRTNANMERSTCS